MQIRYPMVTERREIKINNVGAVLSSTNSYDTERYVHHTTTVVATLASTVLVPISYIFYLIVRCDPLLRPLRKMTTQAQNKQDRARGNMVIIRVKESGRPALKPQAIVSSI